MSQCPPSLTAQSWRVTRLTRSPDSKEKYLRHNYSLQQSFAILSQVDVDNVPLPGPFHPTLKLKLIKRSHPAINGQLVPILGEYFFHFQI